MRTCRCSEMFLSFTCNVYVILCYSDKEHIVPELILFFRSVCLSVIYKVTILPPGPLWPCMCLLHVLGRSPLFSDDVSHCQGWLIWVGKRSQGIDLSHRQPWNVFTEWPRDPQTQVCSRLCKTAPVVTRQTYTGFAYQTCIFIKSCFSLLTTDYISTYSFYLFILMCHFFTMAEIRILSVFVPLCSSNMITS